MFTYNKQWKVQYHGEPILEKISTPIIPNSNG
jgi:hypothetical protein